MPNREKTDNGTDLGFEAQLWKAADALRWNTDAAEYKDLVLGLIFLRYDCDSGTVGRVYKCLLAKIATVAGKLGGGFATLAVSSAFSPSGLNHTEAVPTTP